MIFPSSISSAAFLAVYLSSPKFLPTKDLARAILEAQRESGTLDAA
jgi:hypothetical protein